MSGRKGKVEFYKDKSGEFRWRLKASNGQVIATGGEGYTSEAGCKNGFESVKNHVMEAEVVELY